MDNIRYEIKTEKNFCDAVDSLVESLKVQKFGVLWKLNFKDKLAEKGIDFETNFMIFEVCNPYQAKEVLSRHIDIGYFLPCKLVVYEDNESVKIGMARPQMLMSMMGYTDLEDTAKEVEDTLIKAIDDAAV